jgi:hypothetical protein
MQHGLSQDRHDTLGDGLGVRALQAEAAYGAVDVLNVAPELASDPAIEQAIRARAARYAVIDPALMASVRHITRNGDALRIVADAPEGVRLSELLADLEFGNETLTDATLLDLTALVVRAIATIHQLPGIIAHGAITPAHIVMTPAGSVVLTDCVFGSAFEVLQWNRERVWREFGVALPISASMHRFDQRADVTQLGAVALAIALRRVLSADEYPRAVANLVLEATPIDGPAHASALRMWLQQTLQLHPRSVLSSAVDAHQMFAQVIAASTSRRATMQLIEALVRRRCGRPIDPETPAAPGAPIASAAAARVAHQTPTAPKALARPPAFLRTVFSNLRAT